MAKIIAVANQKGGVGKTTTSINLSSCLAVAGKKTLLVDFDPQANGSSGMGIVLDDSQSSIYEVLTKGTPINDAIIETSLPNLLLLPSKQDLAAIEIEFVEGFPSHERATQFKDIIETVKSIFDYIIIDCPPSLGLLTINALTGSDSVLIPVQTEYFAMEGLGSLMNTIDIIQSDLNEDLEYEGILLCMTDDRTNLSKQVSDEIRSHLGELVYDTVIPRNIRLAESPSFGKPIILYSVASKGAVGYINFTDEFLRKQGV
jgi:chromosome partitioning protein